MFNVQSKALSSIISKEVTMPYVQLRSWWWCYPTPSEGWGRGGIPRRPNRLDQLRIRASGGATRPLPRHGGVEELHGDLTVGPRPEAWTRGQKWKK